MAVIKPMREKIFVILSFILLVFLRVNSQTCTTLGQNPSTAFPVCGTETFSQSTVPYCGGRAIKGPCSNDGIGDTNPFWYKFTCYAAGTLAFAITPNDLNDDYDWEIFDITGHDANDVYTNTSLFVACNWSGNPGRTGAGSNGRSLQNCAGYGYPNFSAMPTLKAGHEYLLLVSHFTRYTPSQNGYQLTFGGGTASITDTLLPDIIKTEAFCDATRILVKLNKRMKCSSLARDGSDFSISPAVATINAAAGLGCSTGFDMDSVILVMSNPLPPGNYAITIKNGSDGNTLLENCDKNVMAGRSLPLVITPLSPTPMDSLKPVTCASKSLQLVFKKNIRCSSIAADGSDFMVTGPGPVTVVSAEGSCKEDVSTVINVVLSGPIVNGGAYRIILTKGTDGNTIFDECAQQTPAGSALSFAMEDTVSAEFTYAVLSGCKTDTVAFDHDGKNGVNQWTWLLDDAGTSNLKNPHAYFTTFNLKRVTLTVSNGFCTSQLTKPVTLGNELKASFEANKLLCPEDSAVFINKSIGDITRYYWDFANGSTWTGPTPAPQFYPVLSAEKTYRISLIVENTAKCLDTFFNTIKVLKSCYIAVPNAFTPNGDGLNDFLYPVNAYKADNLEFSVYNRWGQLVFHTNNWLKKWDGTIKGEPQHSGIYVWILTYIQHDTGQKVSQKGSTVLIR